MECVCTSDKGVVVYGDDERKGFMSCPWQLQLINKKEEEEEEEGVGQGNTTDQHPSSPSGVYLDGLPFDLHHLLSEVHTDGGLRLIGEAPPGEAEGEAGLPHVRVPDNDDLKDPRLDAQLQGGGAQIHGGCEARRGFVAAAGPAPVAPVEFHGGRQDGDIVVRSASSW